VIARSSSGWLADGSVEYLDLADYLLIAEAVLGIPAETIAHWPGIGLADSALHAPRAGFAGVELYPDVIDKAAVLCVRLARNHPLPDGNKRVAYLAMLEFLARNHLEWAPPSVGETVARMEGVAAGDVSEREFADWLRTAYD
jgi:death on curing protein